jgi:hypothetical protein
MDAGARSSCWCSSASSRCPTLFNQQEFPRGRGGRSRSPATSGSGATNTPQEGIGPYDSYMIGGLNLGGDNRLTPEIEAELTKAGYSKDQWLLATDTAVVVPVGKTVLLQVTGADVIHSWTIPAFAVKQDAVPGRIAEAWFKRRQGRHLLRPVQRTVRQGPRLHADHRQGRLRAPMQRLGRRPRPATWCCRNRRRPASVQVAAND